MKKKIDKREITESMVDAVRTCTPSSATTSRSTAAAAAPSAV